MSVSRCPRVLVALFLALVLEPLAVWAQQKPACSPGTQVTTPAGENLCGITTADNVTAYLGIPFAQPPVGNLRWKNPEPPAPRKEIFQAIKQQKGCPQPNPKNPCPHEQSEDCLYLNVWVPDGATPNSKLPVMVFIYGGAFITGSDELPVYNGSSLASVGNVIVVNFNYRLGALGFLVMDGITDAIHNNFGFRDQIQALQWVQTNIASFGGDPTNVTIFGESAGAMSVGLHALSSTLSSGLFKAAIMESNPLGISYMTPQQAAEVGESFAGKLHCTGPDKATCVRAVTNACTLVKEEFQVTKELFSQGIGSLPWAPVIDGTLITQQPMIAAQAGALKLPMLLGTNRNEGNVFSSLIQAARVSPLDRSGYDKILQNVFGHANAALIKKQPDYTCGKALCGPTLANVINDYTFACANRHFATQAQAAIYAYQFTHPSGDDCNPWRGLLAHCNSHSCHGAEVPYVFNTPSDVRKSCTFNKEEEALAKTMGGYWTSFARQQAPAGTPNWPSLKLSNTYMVLDTSPATAIDPWNSSTSNANCSFWDAIGYPATPPAGQANAKR